MFCVKFENEDKLLLKKITITMSELNTLKIPNFKFPYLAENVSKLFYKLLLHPL